MTREEPEEQVDLDGDNENEIEDIDDDEEGVEEEYDRRWVEQEGEGLKEEFSTDGGNFEPEIRAEYEDDGDFDTKESEEKELNEDENEKYAELLGLPPSGSEVFIAGMGKDVTEDDLRERCGQLGEIFEIKFMRDKPSGDHKGCAFITFTTKASAQKAIEELHNKDFRGRKLRCSLSQLKHKLFIGNIPKSWTEEEFRKVIEGQGPGLETVELVKDPQNPGRNRGFAFVDYYNHACADYSRQKMSSMDFKLENSTPTVTWADHRSSSDATAAAQVKAVFVKNLPDSTTQDKLKEIFERHGEVSRIVLPPGKPGQNKREYGFIHYTERSSALKAVKETEKYEIDGQALEVCLAKPQSEKRPDSSSHAPGGFFPSFPAYGGGYGLMGDAYSPMNPGFGSYGQPVIHGRGPAPPGMAMVPMMLPDGRVGYVLQQQGGMVGPPHYNRSRRSDDRGRGGPSDGNQRRRYRPY